MIDVALIDTPVNCDDFENIIPREPCVFIGFILKNEYDNQRLKINEKFIPRKFLKVFKTDKKLEIAPLYGVCLELNETGQKLRKLIKKQEVVKNINLVVYENILSQFELTCHDCYGYFKNGIYPIDFNKFRYLTDDKISEDKKILQHMLNLNESKFDFQKFGSIISLLIV
tara:strand:- start:1997 stop:2506 length:510 start_codon:yes stop_codon:yes gene_type:complete